MQKIYSKDEKKKALNLYSNGVSVTQISKGYGIVVHREGCPNMQRSDQERFINVKWDLGFSGKVFSTTMLNPKALVVSMILGLMIIPVDLIRKAIVSK